MRRLLIEVALFGEPPEVAEQRRSDWTAYLDDLADDRGSAAVLIEAIIGTAAHIFWRMTSSSEYTTIPVAFAFGFSAIASSLFPLTSDPSDLRRWTGDVHLGIALIWLALVLVRTPNGVPYSRSLNAAFVFTATGLFHVASAPYDSPNWAYHQVALIMCGVSALFLSVDSARSRRPFGQSIWTTRCAAISLICLLAVQVWNLWLSPSLGVAIATVGFVLSLYVIGPSFLLSLIHI